MSLDFVSAGGATIYILGKKGRAEIQAVRGHYAEGLKWYCVVVHCGQEAKIRDLILSKLPGEDIEVLMPTLESVTTEGKGKGSGGKLLFNGYLFIRCQMDDDIYMGISACKGVTSILGTSYRVPQIQDDRELEVLQALLACDPGPVLADWPNRGPKAVVTSGMLKGLEGRVFEMDEKNPKIAFQLSFLGLENSVVVALPHEVLSIEADRTRFPRRRMGQGL